MMLEKCYIAPKLESLSQQTKQTRNYHIVSSVILQVKDADINGSLYCLGFMCVYACVCVCVCVCVCCVSVGVCVCLGGGQKLLYPPCPLSRGDTVPYLPKIYGKPCTWWQEFSLELSFEAQSSLQIF